MAYMKHFAQMLEDLDTHLPTGWHASLDGKTRWDQRADRMHIIRIESQDGVMGYKLLTVNLRNHAAASTHWQLEDLLLHIKDEENA